jgi:hypothetical protein
VAFTSAAARVLSHEQSLLRVTAVVVSALVRVAYGHDASTPTSADSPGEGVTAIGKIGRLHERIRRAKARESLYQRLEAGYADYAAWKRGSNETPTLISP